MPSENAIDPVPDRPTLADFVSNNSPPFRVKYARGDDAVEEEFETVDTSRGADIAELHYADGRYVTVRVSRDVSRAEEVTG